MPRRPSEAPEAPDLGGTGGVSARLDLVVTENDTAIAVRSGDVPVLATPRLVALCEEVSCLALRGRVGAGKTTVATRVQFDHLAPVPVGGRVTAEATLVRVEGRRLQFTLSVAHSGEEPAGLVGAGRLTRVVVDTDAFLAKAGVTPAE